MKHLILVLALVAAACGREVPSVSWTEAMVLIANSDLPPPNRTQEAPIGSTQNGYCLFKLKNEFREITRPWPRGVSGDGCHKPLGSVADVDFINFQGDDIDYITAVRFRQ